MDCVASWLGKRPIQALCRDCGQEEVEFDPDPEAVCQWMCSMPSRRICSLERAEPEQVPQRIGVGTRSADRSVVGQSLTLTLKTSNHLCVSEMGRLQFPKQIH